MKKLQDKIALITGGNSGIGLATASLYAHHGARVAITGRNESTITTALKIIGENAIGFKSEMTDIKGTGLVFQSVAKQLGKIDILILNAGVYLGAKLADMTEQQFDELTDINFKSVFFAIQRALPYLSDGASIIITSSSLSVMGMPGVSVYSASKAAVQSLAKSFSVELADRKIRVNILSPGPIETPIIGRGGVPSDQIEKIKTGRAARTLVKRLGTADEIAAGMLYLGSDDSRYLLGAELVLDGGVRIL